MNRNKSIKSTARSRPRVHVAILRQPYLGEILSGRKTWESRLTVSRKPPFEAIEPGDVIYLKKSSGGFVGRARAGRVCFYDALTSECLRKLRQMFDPLICGRDEFWEAKHNAKYATFIELVDVESIKVGPEMQPSRGPAWFVLHAEADPILDIELKPGALRNGYLALGDVVDHFPDKVVADNASSQAGELLTLDLGGGEVIETDILMQGRRLRYRGWKSWFEMHGLVAGDKVRLTRISEYHYRVLPMMNRPQRFVGQIEKDDTTLVESVEQLIHLARQEDMGDPALDVTAMVMNSQSHQTQAWFVARQPGKLAGAWLLPQVAKAYDKSLEVELLLEDGATLLPGDRIARLAGPLDAIVAAERVALNFLTHLSGIATLTQQYVRQVTGTHAAICDTRKTIPGYRKLAKLAVQAGGGVTHRLGLYDAVLVKDNHIAHLSADELAQTMKQARERLAGLKPQPIFFEVEVDRLEQLQALLDLPAKDRPDIILLDNMPPKQLSKAVSMRNQLGVMPLLEASGGVNLETVRAMALTGVDRISIGALTHSAATLDIGLDIQEP